MDKDKILDYVRKTPANTNPNVLKTMLDDSGSEMNPGYSCTETVTLLTDESVTTIAVDDTNFGLLAYSTPIDADNINVTFNGVSYSCSATEKNHDNMYGAPSLEGTDGYDFSVFPFSICSGELGNTLTTEHAGTYAIKIEALSEVVETTPCFEKAVNSVIGGGSGGGSGGETIRAIINEDSTVETLDKTVDEIIQMLLNGSSPFVVRFDLAGVYKFSNLGYIHDIHFNDRSLTYSVNVSGQDVVLTYTASLRNDYPSRTCSTPE